LPFWCRWSHSCLLSYYGRYTGRLLGLRPRPSPCTPTCSSGRAAIRRRAAIVGPRPRPRAGRLGNGSNGARKRPSPTGVFIGRHGFMISPVRKDQHRNPSFPAEHLPAGGEPSYGVRVYERERCGDRKEKKRVARLSAGCMRDNSGPARAAPHQNKRDQVRLWCLHGASLGAGPRPRAKPERRQNGSAPWGPELSFAWPRIGAAGGARPRSSARPRRDTSATRRRIASPQGRRWPPVDSGGPIRDRTARPLSRPRRESARAGFPRRFGRLI